MSTKTIAIPPTGRITLSLDWVADLNVPPRCGAAINSAAWTLPTGITEASSSVAGTVAEVTIVTTNLKLGSTFTLICAVTLDNGDIIPGAVECTAAYRTATLSKAACSTP
jgi:hypothetical protein